MQLTCLVGDTLVSMTDGTLKMIKDVLINDQVVTLNPIMLDNLVHDKERNSQICAEIAGAIGDGHKRK